MPCTYDDREERGKLEQDHRMLTKFICGTFAMAEQKGMLEALFNEVPWLVFEISRADMEIWWRNHKKLDQKRRELKAIADQQLALKKSAISKLTKAERDALGLKGF